MICTENTHSNDKSNYQSKIIMSKTNMAKWIKISYTGEVSWRQSKTQRATSREVDRNEWSQFQKTVECNHQVACQHGKMTKLS